MHDTLDEQVLVQNAIHNPDAFEALYFRYSRRVYSYVASRINHTQDIEDIVSEVFLRVIKNLAQLKNRQQTSFAAWLFVIVRNTITDHYRKNGHYQQHISLEDVEPSAPAEKQPDYIFNENETALYLYKLILTLSERKREIVTLRYYGGLRNQEIAIVLGIREKTVSSYLSRALNELQEKYQTRQSTQGQTSHE
ncbi:hypothetical protein MASR2M15_06660 [Anaerolineales bacterium]